MPKQTPMQLYLKRFRKFLHRLRDPVLRKARGVVHLGANSGQERFIYARRGLDVVWVEAIPEVFAELQRNIGCLPPSSVFCVTCPARPLANMNERAELGRYLASGGSAAIGATRSDG